MILTEAFIGACFIQFVDKINFMKIIGLRLDQHRLQEEKAALTAMLSIAELRLKSLAQQGRADSMHRMAYESMIRDQQRELNEVVREVRILRRSLSKKNRT